MLKPSLQGPQEIYSVNSVLFVFVFFFCSFAALRLKPENKMRISKVRSTYFTCSFLSVRSFLGGDVFVSLTGPTNLQGHGLKLLNFSCRN